MRFDSLKEGKVNFIDIIIILFLLYGAFKGFSRGLIVEIATLAGLILGVYISIRYSAYTEGILRDFFNMTTRYLSYIALALTFIGVVICIWLLGKGLTKFADIISLGLLNKVLGTVLGAAKYFIIVCVLLMIIDAFDDKFHFMGEEVKEKSMLFHPFLNFAQKTYNAIRF